ncbi:3-dehydroquinate synthase [Aristaeella lactis]|uniref:3-dehydroquinate synthase n=1 Tax=Aristaeella lactis TaxID=3046383 RepID=A0AC61PM98_9FIRM|nr:3-dehydroquinate synthase [Aristaeella lactis]QUA53091.1 3-dehydroquinate synthase [Aristaeella lactis]SMC67470.1 3-dehydroquinate synthase [Aristaeella lactis]
MSQEKITLSLGENSYDILLESGCLDRAGELLNLNRKVLVVTDSGVPAEYADTVAFSALAAEIVRIPRGEASKNFDHFHLLLRRMLEFGMGRGDCVAAVGGGVVGDLAGFAAACYMRGIDFYNIPTTVLSQVDSSIGGKTAIDLDGFKNIVGAFHQPRRVLVDPRTLSTLPRRQVANGLAEAVKMALCFDAEGFARYETADMDKELSSLSAGQPVPMLERVILDALRTKKNVVEQDEKEHGLRRVLNFGHTLGHGIESLHEENGLLHGECVALGMLPMCSSAVRERLLPVLERLGLPVTCSADPERVMQAVVHDKKLYAGKVHTIFVDEVGSFTERDLSPEELKSLYQQYFFASQY